MRFSYDLTPITQDLLLFPARNPRQPLHPGLLEFHLHNLNDSPEYASAAALPQALPLGLCGWLLLHSSEQRSLGASAPGHPARGGRSTHWGHFGEVVALCLADA